MLVVRASLRTAIQLTLIALAVAVALAPPGAVPIERWYSSGLYPQLQSAMTSASNRVPIALFDVLMAALALAAIAIWVAAIRTARKKKGRLAAIGRGLRSTLALAAVAYLWFLSAWGLNYARPPLESKLPFDASRVTPAQVRALADHAVNQANRTHAAGHAAGFPGVHDSPQRLIEALHDVERELGRPRSTIVATPKWSVLSPYFRAASVSGMLAPFFLETLINPDLTGPERPATLAHEWAHLAGYAPEADASFVGLLAALRSGPAGEYSAWLDITFTAINQLQPVTRKVVLDNLASGPRADQAAIYRRIMAARIEAVDRAAWSTYDQLLKSQGVEEGVHSYDRVIQLLIGTNALKLP